MSLVQPWFLFCNFPKVELTYHGKTKEAVSSVNGTVQRKPTSLHVDQKREPKFQRIVNNDLH